MEGCCPSQMRCCIHPFVCNCFACCLPLFALPPPRPAPPFPFQSLRAITKEYVPYEEKARLQKKGIFAGNFQPPSQWRKSKREVEAKQTGAAGAGAAGPRAAHAGAAPQHTRPQQPQPQQPHPTQPAASSVGAGTGAAPSYASMVGRHHH